MVTSLFRNSSQENLLRAWITDAMASVENERWYKQQQGDKVHHSAKLHHSCGSWSRTFVVYVSEKNDLQEKKLQ